MLNNKQAYWVWCFYQYRVSFNPHMLQSASKALRLQPCINISKEPVSQYVLSKYHPCIHRCTLTLYEVCFNFGSQGRIVHVSFIEHTLLDAREGSQLTSDPSSQTFSDPDTLPLFQKFEVKVSRSLLVNVAGRILKCLWIISSVKK